MFKIPLIFWGKVHFIVCSECIFAAFLDLRTRQVEEHKGLAVSQFISTRVAEII